VGEEERERAKKSSRQREYCERAGRGVWAREVVLNYFNMAILIWKHKKM